MAPELASPSRAVDQRADVFGLGAILCEILTGAPPFLGGSRSEVLIRAAQACVGDANARLDACGADAELVALARHCLAPAPEDRPPDAGQVAARLGAWFTSTEERTRRLEIAAARARATAKEQVRTRRRTIALAAVVCLSVAGFAWLLFEHQAREYESRMAMVQSIERGQSLTDLGHALLLHGEIDQAMAALRRADDTNPHDTRALQSLVDLARSLGAPDEALEIGRAAAARSPETAGCWSVYGDALLAAGRLRDASAAYAKATALEDNRAHRERLGECLLGLHDFDAAEASFRAAIAHDPTSASAQSRLGSALLFGGHFHEAVAAFERSRELGPASWTPSCNAWIEEAGQLLDAERDLGRVRAHADLGTFAATPEQALAAHLTGRSLLAAQLFAATFARDPAAQDGVLLGWNCDWAVAAAAAVADGSSRDAAELTAAARAPWRRHCIAWLRTAIAAARRLLDNGLESPARTRMRIDGWCALASLQPLLDAAGGEVGRTVRSDLAGLEAALAAGEPKATVQAPFDTDYTLRKLGPVPGVLMPYGGMVFDRTDAEVLLIGGHAQRQTAGLFAASLQRDERGHVCGFRGRARRLASTPYIDGGLAYGAAGTLFFTCFPTSEVGQLRPGSREPDRTDKLPIPSAGGLGFVPESMPGSGRAKILAWPGGQWFDAELATNGRGAAIGQPRQIATLAGGPDGFAWVPEGSPRFERPSILVSEWSRQSIAAYELDGHGDPIIASRRTVVSGMRGALGLAIDPRTGDLLISTWRGDGTEQTAVLEGFRSR